MKAFHVPVIFTALDKFTSPVQKMSRSIDVFVTNTQRSLARAELSFAKTRMAADSMYQRMGGKYVGMAVAGGIGLAVLAIKKFTSEASKIEDATAFFTPVLGSVEKATTLVKMLNKEAAATPFEFNDLSNVATQILPQMNGDLDKTIKTFRMLGDTAGGNVDKLQRITLGYNKALLKGKVTLESLNIIAEAGVPIFTEMAKSMNLGEGVKGTQKLFQMITDGKVPVEEVTKTFEKMTSKGGMFYQGMIIASKTFTGITSTLSDDVNQTAGAFGTAMLPVLKEYATKLIEITAKIRAWVESNKALIGQKFKDWVDKIVTVVKFLYDHFDEIVLITKIYIDVLVALKTISFLAAAGQTAMAVATFYSSVALGVNNALQKKSLFFTQANVVAKYADLITTKLMTAAVWAWTGVLKAVTAAQWLWNIAMNANPISLIIIGILILIGLVTAMIIYWDKWGAAVSLLLGPLGLVISLIMSFVRNWDMITKAFKEGGVLAGFKAIGKVILDAILMPLQQVMELIGKIPGMDWAAKAAKGIEKFRQELGVNVSTEEAPEQEKKVLNPAQERTDAEISRMETVQKQNVTIDINDKGGNASMRTKGDSGIGLNFNSTHQFGLL